VSTEHTNSSPLKWRRLGARGLYQFGGVGLMRAVARSFALQRDAGGGWPSLHRSSVPRFAVLCYHRVGTGGIPLYSELPTPAFEEQMRYLRKSYRILSLDEMVLEMANPGSSEPAVIVTFDDGYRGLFTEAFPILQKYRIPATIFLTVDAIETGNVAWYDRIFLALKVAPGNSLQLELDRPVHFSFTSSEARMQAAVEIISHLRGVSPELRERCCADLESKVRLPEDDLRDRMLTWDQIRTMFRGGVSFGSHTMTHPVVSRLSRAVLEWEILESRRILEDRLQSPVRHFAFPFGKEEECGEAAIAALARAGFRSAATTEWGLNTPSTDPFRLRRVQIGERGSQAVSAFQLAKLFLLSKPEPRDARHLNPSVVAASEPEVEAQQAGR
jgi:peptidoglycan/xylan/chitin deacetylase (PgdA/CDA1 family)